MRLIILGSYVLYFIDRAQSILQARYQKLTFKMEKLGKGGVHTAVLWDLVESDADAEPEFIFRIYSAT